MKMSLTQLIAIAGVGVASASVASAGISLQELIVIDLTTANQITLTATSGASAVTTSGIEGIGIYFESFYAGPGANTLDETLVSGDLTNAENPSDGSPNLFRAGTEDPGLNLFGFSSDSLITFTAGSTAFVGSAVFSLDGDDFADMLAGGDRTGNIWFPADSIGDIDPGDPAQILGTYRVVVPSPGAAAIFGLAGLAAARRRR